MNRAQHAATGVENTTNVDALSDSDNEFLAALEHTLTIKSHQDLPSTPTPPPIRTISAPKITADDRIQPQLQKNQPRYRSTNTKKYSSIFKRILLFMLGFIISSTGMWQLGKLYENDMQTYPLTRSLDTQFALLLQRIASLKQQRLHLEQRLQELEQTLQNVNEPQAMTAIATIQPSSIPQNIHILDTDKNE